MKNLKINLGCWSVGNHAVKNMLPAIDKCQDINLVGIHTRNKDRLEEQSRLYKCFAYMSVEALLTEPSIDAIYISSPTGLHEHQIGKCLEFGKSVLIEKTALPNFSSTKRLVELAESKGLLIMEAFMYRFHSQFKTLKYILGTEKYGKPLKIDCEFGFPHLPKTDIRYSSELCGGALYDAGAYTLSAARHLLDSNYKISTSRLHTSDEFGIDIIGNATIVDQNTVANCFWAFGASYNNRIRIWCELGHIICERAFSKPPDYMSTIEIHHNGETLETIKTGKDNHFVNMLSYFANQVLLRDNKQEHEELLEQSRLISSILNL